jgi:uncharacterized membrane protein
MRSCARPEKVYRRFMRVDLIAVTLAIAMVIAAVRARRSRWDAITLALLSVLWLLANQGFEGPLIWSLDSSHGLTASDLVGLAGLVVAGLSFLRVGMKALRAGRV